VTEQKGSGQEEEEAVTKVFLNPIKVNTLELQDLVEKGKEDSLKSNNIPSQSERKKRRYQIIN